MTARGGNAAFISHWVATGQAVTCLLLLLPGALLYYTVSSVRAMPTKYHAAQQELVHLNLTPEIRKMHQAKY